MSQMGRSFHIISVAFGASSPGGGAKFLAAPSGVASELIS